MIKPKSSMDYRSTTDITGFLMKWGIQTYLINVELFIVREVIS